MKKQIGIAVLGLMTLAGGTWLAAQQRDSVRTTRPDELPQLKEHVDDGSSSRPAEEPQRARRASAASSGSGPSAASPQQTPRQRPAQDARPPAELYFEQAARYPEVARAYDEFRAAGQKFYAPGMQQRMTPEDAARMRAFQEAIRNLRKAEGAEEKSAAREQVTKLVSEQLEVDLANREKELAAIEQRAQELRKQLEERKTAKPELLKMLVMLIDNPQVGLGIPPEWMQMLMRGQSDVNRQGFQIYSPLDLAPSVFHGQAVLPEEPLLHEVPLQPAEPAPPAEPRPARR